MSHPTPAGPNPDKRALVIGAGLSGLIAARELGRAGRRVLVIDKGRSVGGRLATRRIDGAVLDHGAQFFTTRSDELTSEIEPWLADGLVQEWCRGFGPTPDGYPRYCVRGGMNQLAKRIAADFEGLVVDGEPLVTIATGQRVDSITAEDDSFTLTYEDAAQAPTQGSSVVVTAPVPQALDLFDRGGLVIDAQINEGIRNLRYHAVVGLLAVVGSTPDLGPAGARQTPDDPDFTFVANNESKGISPVPAVTFHAAHALSSKLFEKEDDEIAEILVPKAQAVLGSTPITSYQVKKWRYAGPTEPWPDRTAVITEQPGLVVMAGDAFGGAKVEGAYLSGRAAAARLLAWTD